MRRLRVTILDLVTKGPTRKVFGRVMNPDLASIMPQAAAAWCEEHGHDIRFVRPGRKPRVGWHDPNFGVRFDDCMGAIEDAVPPGRIDFVAESSLSLLSEPNLERLQKNGLKGRIWPRPI